MTTSQPEKHPIAPAAIPIQDLTRLHGTIRDELRAVFDDHLNRSAFIQGAAVRSFEDAFSQYTGIPHTLGVANGTDALEMVVEALGIGAGSAVIVPAMTFTATAEAVVRQGATPIFADIDPMSWCLSPSTVEEAANRSSLPVKAVILVHLHGRVDPATVELRRWCDARGATLIEDCAQAHGARLAQGGKSLHAGSWGAAATFSFYPGKNLGALGDGGAIATASDQLAARLRLLRDHGRTEKYLHQEIGRNSRLDALQAGFLKVKLARLDGWNEGRRSLAAHYRKLLATQKGFTLVPEPAAPREHVYHQLAGLIAPNVSRDAVKKKLAAMGIETAVHYPLGLHQQPAFQAMASGLRLPVTEDIAQHLLCLPMDPLHGPEIAARVAGALAEALKELS